MRHRCPLILIIRPEPRLTREIGAPQFQFFVLFNSGFSNAQSGSIPHRLFSGFDKKRVTPNFHFFLSKALRLHHIREVSLLTSNRYGIFGLKTLACNKFAQELSIHLDSSEFPEACQEAYETTFHTDRGLRDIIIQAFRANPGLSLRQDMELVIRETPSLAFELFKMASGLPVAS